MGKNDNVEYLNDDSLGSGDGGDGGDTIGERLARLEERSNSFASKNDIKDLSLSLMLAIKNLQIWILCGVIGGILAAITVSLSVVGLFSG